MRIGLPSGVLSSFFSVSNVIIQSGINGFGYEVMAGNSTGASLEAFVYTSMNAVSSATTTFAGQNAGAKRNDRIKGILANSCIITFLISIFMGTAILLLGEPLASLYSRDPVVIGYALDRMKIILPLYFVCGMVENFVGCLRGMNYSVLPMIPSFLCVCVYRIIWVYTIFKVQHTTTMLYLTYPISWIMNIALDAGLFVYAYFKHIRVGKSMREYKRAVEYERVSI